MSFSLKLCQAYDKKLVGAVIVHPSTQWLAAMAANVSPTGCSCMYGKSAMSITLRR
jgi:hypothetical protein